jgi:hypothetical protein
VITVKGLTGRRRLTVVVGVAVVVLVAAALVARAVWLRDSARSVDASEALDRYRNSTTSVVATSTDIATTEAPVDLSLPAPGVYSYATNGSESVDLLGGATHAYPARTTLTVTPSGCGVHLRWDLLAERREEWNLCITERGIEYQVSSSQYHEFFGQGEENTVECDRTVVVWPIELTEGAVTEPLCTIRGQEWLPRWEVIGADTRLLEGHEIDTMHVRLTVHDTDGYLETTTIDWWIDEHGLPVEMRATEDSTADSGAVGDLHYLETYQAALVSATPME